MNGRKSMRKSLQHVRHVQASRSNPYKGPYMEVGSWRFQENAEGDLVIMNVDTQQTVILIKKEQVRGGLDG